MRLASFGPDLIEGV